MTSRNLHKELTQHINIPGYQSLCFVVNWRLSPLVSLATSNRDAASASLFSAEDGTDRSSLESVLPDFILELLDFSFVFSQYVCISPVLNKKNAVE
jgi:hypothetical protein